MLPGLCEVSEHASQTSGSISGAGSLVLPSVSSRQLHTIREQQTPSPSPSNPYSHQGPFNPPTPTSTMTLAPAPSASCSSHAHASSHRKVSQVVGAGGVPGASRKAPGELHLSSSSQHRLHEHRAPDHDTNALASASTLYPEVETPTALDELVDLRTLYVGEHSARTAMIAAQQVKNWWHQLLRGQTQLQQMEDAESGVDPGTEMSAATGRWFYGNFEGFH